MDITGQVFKFENTPYRFIAQKETQIVAVENVSDNEILRGDVEFLVNPSTDSEDDTITCAKSYFFGRTKEEYYKEIKANIDGKIIKSGLFGLKKKKLAPVDVNDTQSMVSALHKEYYKTPTEFLELIVIAYQNNM